MGCSSSKDGVNDVKSLRRQHSAVIAPANSSTAAHPQQVVQTHHASHIDTHAPKAAGSEKSKKKPAGGLGRHRSIHVTSLRHGEHRGDDDADEHRDDDHDDDDDEGVANVKGSKQPRKHHGQSPDTAAAANTHSNSNGKNNNKNGTTTATTTTASPGKRGKSRLLSAPTARVSPSKSPAPSHASPPPPPRCDDAFAFRPSPSKSKNSPQQQQQHQQQGGGALPGSADSGVETWSAEGIAPIFAESTQELDRINQFRLLGVLGNGAFGYVRESRSDKDGNTYALKCISKRALMRKQGLRGAGPGGVTLRLEDCKQEVATLLSLSHPHIARLFQVIGDDQHDMLYLVYEFVPLGPVMVLDENTKPFTEDRARLLFRQLVEAVDFLHARSIVHKDIKPANILLATKNTIKLVDFGLTHMLSNTAARLRRNVGTPAFQSPEAIGGEAAAAADVWAMGITLHCFLFGRIPWPAVQNVLQLYRHVREDALVFDSSMRLSPFATDLLRALLDKSAPRRPTAAQTLQHEWLARAPVRVRGVGGGSSPGSSPGSGKLTYSRHA